MKVSTITLSLLSSSAIVAAIPVSHPTRTSKDSVIVLTGTRLSPITTTFGTVVRRTAPYEPTHSSEKDSFSKWQSELAADAKPSWDSRLLEHWSSTHIEPKPTEDADGMSISWRTNEPSPATTTPSTVVKRSDGIRDPHWFSGPTNIAELDCPNVCNWACFYHGGCTDEAYQAWLDETSQSYSSAWSSRLMSHYNATHVPAKPTADASGMSISWRTIYPNSTGMA
ncbi:hypothetical protein KCU77_g10571, partial [Aureobasidium melanogenum]